jgi:glycosyltransferase involved in cell wall biosynthesis
MMFPDLLSSDPYCRLLDGALRRRGIEVQRGRGLERGRSFARDLAGRVDVVHLHWIELLFWPGGHTPLRRLASMHSQARRTISALRSLSDAGVRLAWTVHNSPLLSQSAYASVHLSLQSAVAQAADIVLVHSHYAAAEVRRLLAPTAPVQVVPHGGYAGVYPPASESREQTRRRLGLPLDAFVFLMFGTLREYKQVPEAILAFRSLHDSSARLLVAGAPESSREATERAAGADPRVRLELGAIPEHEVANLFGAADVLVLNYAEVFSSGALLLALASGLPVVAPARGSATELAPPPATTAFREGGLADALARARENIDRRREAARAAARVASWDRTAALLEEAYRQAPVRPEADSIHEVVLQ